MSCPFKPKLAQVPTSGKGRGLNSQAQGFHICPRPDLENSVFALFTP